MDIPNTSSIKERKSILADIISTSNYENVEGSVDEDPNRLDIPTRLTRARRKQLEESQLISPLVTSKPVRIKNGIVLANSLENEENDEECNGNDQFEIDFDANASKFHSPVPRQYGDFPISPPNSEEAKSNAISKLLELGSNVQEEDEAQKRFFLI